MDAHGDSATVFASLKGLRVALVHDWINGRRGGEKCLEVACAAFSDAQLFTLFHVPGSAGPVIDRMAIRPSPLQQIPGINNRYRSLLPLMPAAARCWKVAEVDLVVSFSHCVAKAVRVPPHVPHICYCFTPMRYAWDGREAYLQSLGRLKRVIASPVLGAMRRWDRRTARRVSHFLAISQTVQQRIERCYQRTSEIIYPPVDVDFYTPWRVPREDFYLVVSALVPYKRIEQAIEACQSLGKRLVVIGEGPERPKLSKLASKTTCLLGWQPDEVIRDHMRRCRALLFPGEEDFGIVPIEALACAAPVIALDAGAVPETIDDAVGRLYREPTAPALAAAVADFEAGAMAYDPAEARRRAERFSTNRFRDELLGYVARVVGEARSPRSVVRGPHRGASRSQIATRSL
jgi:glycosyltransferase involved in cell wall biosynthesis